MCEFCQPMSLSVNRWWRPFYQFNLLSASLWCPLQVAMGDERCRCCLGWREMEKEKPEVKRLAEKKKMEDKLAWWDKEITENRAARIKRDTFRQYSDWQPGINTDSLLYSLFTVGDRAENWAQSLCSNSFFARAQIIQVKKTVPFCIAQALHDLLHLAKIYIPFELFHKSVSQPQTSVYLLSIWSTHKWPIEVIMKGNMFFIYFSNKNLEILTRTCIYVRVTNLVDWGSQVYLKEAAMFTGVQEFLCAGKQTPSTCVHAKTWWWQYHDVRVCLCYYSDHEVAQDVNIMQLR